MRWERTERRQEVEMLRQEYDDQEVELGVGKVGKSGDQGELLVKDLE